MGPWTKRRPRTGLASDTALLRLLPTVLAVFARGAVVDVSYLEARETGLGLFC